MIQKLRFKTWVSIFAILVITLFLARPWVEKALNRAAVTDPGNAAIDFVDDSGFRVRLDKPAGTVISLYSAHTENLYALGLDREIIGVGTSDIYPPAAIQKPQFDYKSDPEKVIAQKPDIVLIRPFIERNSPDFVSTLRRSGITVVSLYPETMDQFDDYILKLALITGKTDTAKQKLDGFHKKLAELEKRTASLPDKPRVYFESSDRDYTTVTVDSMPAAAIRIAGGENIATDVVPIEEGSSIAAYGIERILKRASEIDVFVTQRGVMGGGGNTHSISIRPGFNALKAVQENRVVEINQKIISSPTFRFVEGVEALQRVFYPQLFDALDYPVTDAPITREELAEVLVKFSHSTFFIPASSDYDVKGKNHYYGLFEDVPLKHPRFHFIETAVQKGYFESFKNDEVETFQPEAMVTRQELAIALYLLRDMKAPSDTMVISDITGLDKQRLIQTVVSNGYMDLESGSFQPDKAATWKEVLSSLDRLGRE